MAPSTRRTPRSVTKSTPAYPPGPARSSGVKKSSKRLSLSRARRLPKISEERLTNEKRGHRSAVDAITTMMASLTISKRPTKQPKTEKRERQSFVDDVTAMMMSNTPERPTQRLQQSAILRGPPITLTPPPTKLEASLAAAPEPVPERRIALNCRYRLPNSYLTVYHRRGHRMLCMPWEMPWLEGEERAVWGTPSP